MLRPVPARWFEVLVAQNDAAAALEALAGTGAIELELHAADRALAPLAELKPAFDIYRDLANRYRPYWPAPTAVEPLQPRAAREILDDGLERIDAWRVDAEPVIRQLQALEQEAAELQIWRELFAYCENSEIEFGLLHRPEALLARRLYVLPPEAAFALPAPTLAQRFELPGKTCLLVVGPLDVIADLDRRIAALRGRRLGLDPGWLEGRAADSRSREAQRRADVDAELGRLRNEIDALNRRHELAPAIAGVERLNWFASQVPELPSTDYFAWLTGWTSDLHGSRLTHELNLAGVRALLRFPLPPVGVEAPLILRNPWWARPFELFARAVGVPARNEVDPSSLLALVIPLMFGYMFGDVGQGLVIMLAGLCLRRRFAVARLLTVGGAAAVAFGFLFGSVFGREDWIAALWLHPLEAPLTLLVMPLMGGALLLALGLALNAVETLWRGELRRWLASEAGILLFYVASIGAIVQQSLWWAALAGIVWFMSGHALLERRWAAVFSGLGLAFERTFQLAVNTLSFARVGAFALAHAGLGVAITTLAEAAGGNAAIVVMIAGNILVIALEGLVVSIQTTRLVLFEFFIRFLRSDGRPFRPLAAPA